MFIHVCIDGHFFHFLSVMNYAAVNICVQVLCECQSLFLWDKCSGMQLLGLMGSVYLVL